MTNAVDYATPPRPQQVSDSPAEPPPPGNALTARGVVRSFRMGDTAVTILKGVDLDVRPGEFLAIEGRSGSGKSTLLHVLAGLDAADAGHVFAGPTEIGRAAAVVSRWRRRAAELTFGVERLPGWLYVGVVVVFGLASLLLGWLVLAMFNLVTLAITAPADRRLSRVRNKQFGFVFQFYHLLPELTVLENAMLAPMVEHSWRAFRRSRAERRRRATDLLGRFGLSHRLRHFPSQLSGGERQRVAIARALMNDPQVLFADEPTGNLDDETGRQIMDVLEALHRDHGQTIVMVTHDRALAREADRVLVLRDGRLEEVTG